MVKTFITGFWRGRGFGRDRLRRPEGVLCSDWDTSWESATQSCVLRSPSDMRS